MLPDPQHHFVDERRQRLMREAAQARRHRLAAPRPRQPRLALIRRSVGLRLVALGTRLADGGRPPGLGVTHPMR